MPESNRRLSPMEFLAELKGRNTATAPTALPDSDSQPVEDSDNATADGDASHGEGVADARGTSDATAPDEQRRNRNDNGLMRRSPLKTPSAVRGNSQLSDLFARMNTLLGSDRDKPEEAFRPRAPETLDETRLTVDDVERLILKFLLAKASATGRAICTQICLPFHLVDPILKQLKQEHFVAFKGAAEMGDYEFILTEIGRDRARRYSEQCTYFGTAPVSLQDYLNAMEEQSIAKQHASEDDLREAFSDLVISDAMVEKLGPAVNSGRGMFIFGQPGNGKTSIAERIARCFKAPIWIPRALGVDGVIIRLFDPGIHEVIEEVTSASLFDTSDVDQRWVKIVRPTVIAGGELTMEELEVVQNVQTKICEAPLQLKSNCGTLVIDDFGRQTMPAEVLLNRWIVPLEKRYDFLNLPSGKKIQVPFDQLIIFSTNLEPKDLVDDAFLRRIPYKIEVANPTPDELRALFKFVCPPMGFRYDRKAVDYLIERHYQQANRSPRACHPRDLLLQVKNFCAYKGQPKKLSPEAFDFAVENYFSVM